MGSCERWLGSRGPATAAEILGGAAEALPADVWPDRYGEGEWFEAFERRMADLLGHDAAALLPSGAMAQQIALRIHCDPAALERSRFTRPATSSCMSTPPMLTCTA